MNALIISLLEAIVISSWSLCTTAASPKLDLGLVLERALDVYAPVSSELGEGACRAQGLVYKQAVKEGQVWALNMFDSSSKLPSGVLTGNLIQFGNFDQCLKVQHSHPELGLIHGQHCKVHFGADNFFTLKNTYEKSSKFRKYILEHFEITRLMNASKTAEAFRKMGATLSVCVPAACSPRDLQLHLRAALIGLLGDAVNVSVPYQGCSARRIDTGSYWLTIPSIGMWSAIFVISMVVIGTVNDLCTLKKPRNSVLLAFSAYTNIRSLTRTSTSGNALPVLNGIRVISIIMILMVHQFVVNQLVAPKINFHENMKLEGDWSHLTFTSGSIGVDSFLLLAGTLITYNFLADRKEKLQFNPLMMYLRRYLRITPSVIAAILMRLMIANKLSASNLHTEPKGETPAEDVCKYYWWMQLLYITNNLPAAHLCVDDLWYASLDMQLVWISPFFLYPLWRWPRIGKIIIGAVVFLGIAINYTVVYVLGPIYANSRQRYRLFDVLYLNTFTRFGPWFIGFILGHILHGTTKDTRRISKMLVALGWLLTIGLMMTSLFYLHSLYQMDVSYISVVDKLFVSAMRSAWALGLAILIFLCVSGYGGICNTLLSSPKFLVPSRLVFGVFVSNRIIFLSYFEFRKYPIHYNDATLIVELIGLTVVNFAFAFLVHIFVEAPASVLGRFLLDRMSRHSLRDKPTADNRCVEDKNTREN